MDACTAAPHDAALPRELVVPSAAASEVSWRGASPSDLFLRSQLVVVVGARRN